ncbi:ABC transporter ATP-binding protein [Petrotoga sibirica]|uniref:ABC-2 type transport system ATP-binding protein n=2 Tax=Petrotoga sibirica TaxID=156202 RepID=A0A4R8EW79_9BACT|nr:ABC transporter ATP-binding protein [Petrotoga sibirica]POZ88308.1 ABC transporter [Petrotoga sibirica DSM 13575]TDX15005.1 ABC-2 type transport system ATP-binding protein [Petrotoga sibirica]
MNVIEVNDLLKRYPQRTSKEMLTAVDKISFHVKEGEIFALLGPNGAGKTTTIKSICGLLVFDEGKIKIKDYDLKTERSKALKQISVVLEGSRNLYHRLTPIENIQYFVGIRGKKISKNEALDILDFLGIKEKANEVVYTLSRGMQQKTALAVCLAADTDVLLLDEPTLGLDVISNVEFRRLLTNVKEKGKSILLSTHDMALVEEIADRVAIINNGKIVVCEDKKKLMDIFSATGYKIKVRSEDTLERELDKIGITQITKESNIYDLTVDFKTSSELYEVIDFFKSRNVEIVSIEKQMVNFEKIFISYTNGDRGRQN